MHIIINQPRASYFVGGGELISFDHAINFIKLGDAVTFITINPDSIGLKRSDQYLNFCERFNDKIKIIEINQSKKITDIYEISPGENRCRWNIESIFYNQELYDFLILNGVSYDCILSYYNLDAVFIPKKLIKTNVLYLCGYPKQQDDYQGSFLSVYDKVFAISEETKNYWQKYRENEINIISTGVDFERFSIKDKQKHDKIIILFVGRLIARKNVDKIIFAYEKLREKYNLELIVVGDGPERKYLESLSGDVKFTGIISNTEKLYQMADIFVSPSEYGEGVQGTILEAMSTGLKIVATDSKINRVLLDQERGVIVESNIDAIVSGIEQAIKMDAQKTANKTRKYIMENYSWLAKTTEMRKDILK